MASDCIFCKIIEGSIPAATVYEDDKVVAIMDIMPVNPGHVLVIPKTHFRELSEMDEEAGMYLFRVGMRIERALRRSGLRVEGTNLLQNNGRAAFQEVPHVHLHVIPRFSGDGMKVQFGQEKAEPEKLQEWAGLIKRQIEA